MDRFPKPLVALKWQGVGRLLNVSSGGAKIPDVTLNIAHTGVFCSRANSTHIRQSRSDSGLGFLAQILEVFSGVPFSLGDWI